MGVDGIGKVRDARWKRADEMESAKDGNMGGTMERPRWKGRATPQVIIMLMSERQKRGVGAQIGLAG